MGVTGLWTILQPCARPIKLETLNRKRLAVDASIWIYQFLKAVRDKEGNALRNSHVVGFFRRICKLLFFGIKPVFVFDGGAPTLKRQTINNRKRRREGRREDAVRTAGKLLAVQMQRRAEEEEAGRKERQKRRDEEEETVPDDALVYVDEMGMSQQERQQNRRFRKKDAYHLPDLDVSISEMGGPNDPRVMSLEELQAYAKQFETGEDINVYDFSQIDFDSPFFVSLPPSDRYNILNAARLRSRLRMGHSKEQLDTMFPDRMAFSRFQIERVRERNELTQRLMHLNEGGDTLFNTGRVAGEKGREYVLVKNEGVEGGWALGVISEEGTKQETAIDVDKPVVINQQLNNEDDDDDDNDFEDVPIEGLNRLPKRKKQPEAFDVSPKRRKFGHRSTTSTSKAIPQRIQDPDSLFIANDTDDVTKHRTVDIDSELFGDSTGENRDDDEELRRAIAMSLEQTPPTQGADERYSTNGDGSDDEMREVFHQSAVPEAKAIPKAPGRAIANIVNKRAFAATPETREISLFGVPVLRPDVESDSDPDDSMNFQAALTASRNTQSSSASQTQQTLTQAPKVASTSTDIAKQAGFSGPLPFKKLDLGASLLGRKKMEKRAEENAGGFENPELKEKDPPRTAEPLPPWFTSDIVQDVKHQKAIEDEDRQRSREFQARFQFQSRGAQQRYRDIQQVVDLEAEDETPNKLARSLIRAGEDFKSPIDLDDEVTSVGHAAEISYTDPLLNRSSSPEERLRIENQQSHGDGVRMPESSTKRVATSSKTGKWQPPSLANDDEHDNDSALDWSESEPGNEQAKINGDITNTADNVEEMPRSPSAEFEDVPIPSGRVPARPSTHERPATPPDVNLTNLDQITGDVDEVEFDDFSDPEDEELLLALAQEAEEHARFASTLNNKSQAQNIADYEKELKQLRNQQKKDRRDADEITQVMIQECQQLLRHFGLPYVTAPMEAEAQCAELVRLGLVDGIVTDDSDCFLFGGTRIYKNMFNQAKFVECYLATDLEKEFDLTREKLIQIAHLLGSDYTEGLPGVGPVTALEILGEFQTLDDFKTWWSGVQMNIITKSEDSGRPFRKKFRKNATKLFLPPIFPDTRVDLAYMNPEVDSNPEQFQWGVPDLISLRTYLMATIGWSEERTDEVLVPVIRDMNRRADEGTQSNITAFFDGSVGVGPAKGPGSKTEAFAPRKRAQESSKRMGSALTKMAENAKTSRNGSSRAINADDNDMGKQQDSSAETTSDTRRNSKRKTNGSKRLISDDSS